MRRLPCTRRGFVHQSFMFHYHQVSAAIHPCRRLLTECSQPVLAAFASLFTIRFPRESQSVDKGLARDFEGLEAWVYSNAHVSHVNALKPAFAYANVHVIR